MSSVNLLAQALILTLSFSTSSHAVVNGTPVPENSALLRSTVQIEGLHRLKPSETCTGVIITKRQILTAGHCAGYRDVQDTWVNLFVKQGRMERSVPVVSGIVHTDFWREHTDEVIALEEKVGVVDPAVYQHDIAVLTLPYDLPETAVIADLLPNDGLLKPGLEVEAAGFGVTDATQNNRAKMAELKTLRSTKLRIKAINKNVVETAAVNGGNTAAGDSGGPVYVVRDGRPYVWGLTSYGAANSAFVLRVQPFKDFIRKVIRTETPRGL